MNLDSFRGVVNACTVCLCGALAVLLIPVVSHADGNNNAPVSVSTSEVTVRVSVLETKSRQALKDRSGVAVWLVPMDNSHKAGFDAQQPHYQMMQHNKMFEPHLLVVPAGSIVEFPNHDPWFHNAFSISNGRFDLGLYRTGVRKSVKFDRAGASYVFCRIHPEMAAVVLTVDSAYFGVSDQAGHISISKVPCGKYILRVWYEDATRKTLEALQNPVVVGHERSDLPSISVAMTKQVSVTHEDQRWDETTLGVNRNAIAQSILEKPRERDGCRR